MAQKIGNKLLKTAFDDVGKEELESSALTNYFSKGKLRCVFIYPDGSFREVYRKMDKNYFIEDNKMLYQIVPKCIVKGKKPMIMWYYNNPAPIHFKYKKTDLNVDKLRDGVDIVGDKNLHIPNTSLDSEGLHAAFSSTLMKGLYAENKINGKTMVVGLIIGAVILLVIMQASGVDIMAYFTGQGG